MYPPPGLAPDHRGFRCSPATIGHCLELVCPIEQELIAGESAPVFTFMRFKILLKKPNDLRLMMDPRNAGSPSPGAYGGSVALKGDGTKGASVSIDVKAIRQALPMWVYSLCRLDLCCESLDGYGDWLLEETAPYGLCLECLVHLARRTDWPMPWAVEQWSASLSGADRRLIWSTKAA
jgi:hypothetical protein